MSTDRRRRRPEQLRRRATPGLLVALGAAYVALSLAVWQLADPTETSAPWWPAAGLTLGVLCRVRRADWPAVLAVVFAADVAADLIQGAAFVTSLGWATANTVEPLLGALAMGRVFRDQTPNIESPTNVLRFFGVAALAGTPVAALIGGTTSALTYDLDLVETWRLWYIGDVIGILLVAPAVLYAPQIRAAFDARFATMLAVTAAVALLVFRAPEDWGLGQPYLVTPTLVLAALWFGAPGAVMSAMATALLANVASAQGYGPFALGDGDTGALGDLQVFVAVQMLTTFLVVGLRAQLLTARAQAERLSEEQLRDPLTGTGSRIRIEDELAAATSQPAVGGTPPSSAVLFLDLDAFKPVNDRYGHAVGDEVLCTVASRLEEAVRDTDTVGRVGGDEFVVVCRDITPAELDRLAVRLTEAIAEPMQIDGHDIAVGASIGTSWATGAEVTPSDLLRSADVDMYRRKLGRRN
ncbi:diguanylate cyclase [Svornostia abyssi]|uniref:Diguanylate cyclase n=1 Tax=Svornostia abyssi TaxID=2898438 RepID=A0ABY5PGI1_9ACTN|nr:diguanylate cyclase [Parviterribacteraceae bacterium J379]